jgi:hypothetical protein
MNPPSYNKEGKHIFMDPLSGNAMIGLSRLNVADGMRKLYERAWKRDDRRWGLPYVEEVEPGRKVDITRCGFVEEEKTLVWGVAQWDAKAEGVEVGVTVGNVEGDKEWVLVRDGKVVAEQKQGGICAEEGVKVSHGDNSTLVITIAKVGAEEQVFGLKLAA